MINLDRWYSDVSGDVAIIVMKYLADYYILASSELLNRSEPVSAFMGGSDGTLRTYVTRAKMSLLNISNFECKKAKIC